jgi:hypothetical protein
VQAPAEGTTEAEQAWAEYYEQYPEAREQGVTQPEGVEAAPEAVAEPFQTEGGEAAAEPVPEAAAEPVPEAVAEPVPEAVAEPVPEAAAEPVPEDPGPS